MGTSLTAHVKGWVEERISKAVSKMAERASASISCSSRWSDMVGSLRWIARLIYSDVCIIRKRWRRISLSISGAMCNGDGVDYVLLESTEVTNYHHVDDREQPFVLWCTRRLFAVCSLWLEAPES